MEKIEERIRKLLALASNNPNEAEAAAAMAKARELMIEHAIEVSPNLEAEPEVTVVTLRAGRVYYKWQKRVQHAVSLLFDGYMVISKEVLKNRYVDAIHIAVAKYDAPYVIPAFIQVMNEIDKAGQRYSKYPAQRSSFLAGAADGFFKAVYNATKASLPSEEMTAIVHVKSAAIEKFAADQWPNTKNVKLGGKVSDYSAYADGYVYGNNMSTDRSGKKQLED